MAKYRVARERRALEAGDSLWKAVAALNWVWWSRHRGKAKGHVQGDWTGKGREKMPLRT